MRQRTINENTSKLSFFFYKSGQVLSAKIALFNRFPIVLSYLVKVENNVELADVAKVPVEDFHEEMNHFQRDKLVVVLVNASHEEEGRVALVHNLFVAPFDKITPAEEIESQRYGGGYALGKKWPASIRDSS
jgi:hypothetical protein